MRSFAAVLMAFVPMALVVAPAWAAELTGPARVIDGATIEVAGERVRLAGIGAPERGQPYGERSAETLAGLLGGREVRVDANTRDRDGQLIGKVFVQPPHCPWCAKTRDVGLGQVRAGSAWWLRRYANAQTPEDRERYESAEREARGLNLGLWAETDPVAPEEWRRGDR